MDQNKCVALLTAIDLGNLTRAAEQLGYTQSGLSYVIKTLETELGFPLLVRSRTGVRPTEDCQRILPLLRDLDRKSRQLEQEAADIRGLQRRRVIHSVSGHCHLVPLSLECLYQFLLLLRCHSCKYGILPADCIIIRLLTDG